MIITPYTHANRVSAAYVAARDAIQGALADLNQRLVNDLRAATGTPHIAQIEMPDQVVVTWLCPSAEHALLALRCWYAGKLVLLRLEIENDQDREALAELERIDPAAATLEEIQCWYASGEAGYTVSITRVETDKTPYGIVVDDVAAVDLPLRRQYEAVVREAIHQTQAAHAALLEVEE